ncbi:MAG: cysteine desulfurase [Alphaproteobacteria bacterium]|nr:cysteine desulfurase [Alphaproteobacteria bacterium]
MSDWRTWFPFLAEPQPLSPHYLDNAATTQIVRPALDALIRAEVQLRANVHRAVHARGEAATQALEQARTAIAAAFGVVAEEIIFTSGTTHALNLLANGLGAGLQPGDQVVVSALEHHANLLPWQQLVRTCGIRLVAVPVDGDGTLSLTALAQAITPRTRVVALGHASNVTGAVLDVAAVRAMSAAVGAKLVLDGAQMARHGPVDLMALGVDAYACSGHKLFGPTGIGVLWAKADLLATLPPLLVGGSMIRQVTLDSATWADPPRRFEAGTPPIAAAIGLGAALQWLATQDHAAMLDHEARLTQRLLEGLAQISAVRVLGPGANGARIGVVSLEVAGAHPHDVCQILDRHGVAARGGHHCCQPLMAALDLDGTTRLSTAPYTSQADIDAALTAIDDAVRTLT